MLLVVEMSQVKTILHSFYFWYDIRFYALENCFV